MACLVDSRRPEDAQTGKGDGQALILVDDALRIVGVYLAVLVEEDDILRLAVLQARPDTHVLRLGNACILPHEHIVHEVQPPVGKRRHGRVVHHRAVIARRQSPDVLDLLRAGLVEHDDDGYIRFWLLFHRCKNRQNFTFRTLFLSYHHFFLECLSLWLFFSGSFRTMA